MRKLNNDKIKITEYKDHLCLTGLSDFDVSQIFDCGQCFRFDADITETGKKAFSGIAYGRYIRIEQPGEDKILLYNVTETDFYDIWVPFFSIDENYSIIKEDIIKRFGQNDVICEALKYGAGIRILRQEPWETLCSFIISQNNNIPRIKKIIAKLCEDYGSKINVGDNVYYKFPSPEAVAEADPDQLMKTGAGFRVKYILDAAKRVSGGQIDLSGISKYKTNQLLEVLQEIYGVGPKVASCVALFAYNRTESFPIDVWIGRVIKKYYPEGLDISSLGDFAGIAQQYLFYYERWRR